MMRIAKRALAILLGLTLPMAFASAAPEGAADPAFLSARDAWLDDDDQTALPALARLAQADNRAAQILLGRIATRPMSEWLARLERKERIALLRAPGGLSGTSWLKVAATAGDPLAQLFLDAEDPRASDQTVRSLVEGEELAAALVLIDAIRNRKGDAPQAVLLSLWREGQLPVAYAGSFVLDALLAGTLTNVEFSDLRENAPYPVNVIIAVGLDAGARDQQDWAKALEKWAQSARKDQPGWSTQTRIERIYSEPAPLFMQTARHTCDQICGQRTDNAKLCYSFADFVGSTRYFGSPAQALVSQAQFVTSPRARRLLGEHIASTVSSQNLGKNLPTCAKQALGLL